MYRLCLIPALCFFTACSTVQDSVRTTQRAATAVGTAVTDQEAPSTINDVGRPDDLGDAMMTPVRDLNVRQVSVPTVLRQIDDIYAQPGNCSVMREELVALEYALGPDYDVPTQYASRRERAERTGLGLIGSTIGGLIPFRSVVRELTGASAKERELRDYYRRGLVRRGFLRGFGQMKGC